MKQLEAKFNNLGTTSDLRAVCDTLEGFKNKMTSLPVAGVDQDLLNNVAKGIEMLNETISIIRRLADLIDENAGLVAHAKSSEAFSEALVRGYLGDPFGKAQEVAAYSQQLSAQLQSLGAEWNDLERRLNASDAEDVRLRGLLSKRYGREFPAL